MKIEFSASDYSDFLVDNGGQDTIATWHDLEGNMSVSIGIHGEHSYKKWESLGLPPAVKIVIIIEPLAEALEMQNPTTCLGRGVL